MPLDLIDDIGLFTEDKPSNRLGLIDDVGLFEEEHPQPKIPEQNRLGLVDDIGLFQEPERKEPETFLGRVGESWETGKLQTRLGQLRAKQLYGDTSPEVESEITRVKGLMPKGKAPKRSLPERAIRSAVEMAPTMVTGMEEGAKRGLALGTGFGVMAGIAGQAGPQIALPEEAITVPAAFAGGFGVGMTSGTLQNIGEIEAGLAYEELIDLKDDKGNRIDPTIAKAAASGVGVINGLIELGQVKLLLKGIPGAEKILSSGIREAVKKAVTSNSLKNLAFKAAARYGGVVAAETGQEVVQESTNIVATELAKSLTNKLKGTNLPEATRKEIIDRLKETAIESALAFTVMGAPGTAGTIARRYRLEEPQYVSGRNLPTPTHPIIEKLRDDLETGKATIADLEEIAGNEEFKAAGLTDEVNRIIQEAQVKKPIKPMGLEVPEQPIIDLTEQVSPFAKDAGESAQVFMQAEQKEREMRQSPEGARLLKEQLAEQQTGKPTAFQQLISALYGKRVRLREQQLSPKQIEDQEFADYERMAATHQTSEEDLAEAKRFVDRMDEDKAFRDWAIKSQQPITEPPKLPSERLREVLKGKPGRWVDNRGGLIEETPPTREMPKVQPSVEVPATETPWMGVEKTPQMYRGGPESAMPKGMTAQDIIDYETKELGNKINVEQGIDLKSIPSERLKWFTTTEEAAKEYGETALQDLEPGSYRTIANDNYNGVLVELLPRKAAPPAPLQREEGKEGEIAPVEVPKVEAAPEAKGKELWEMTREEFIGDGELSDVNEEGYRTLRSPVFATQEEAQGWADSHKGANGLAQINASGGSSRTNRPHNKFQAVITGYHLSMRDMRGLNAVDDIHKNAVEKALSEGKPVPSAVLADYPELTQKKLGEKIPPKSPKEEAQPAEKGKERPENKKPIGTPIPEVKREATRVDKFIASMSPMAQGKVRKTLDVKMMNQGQAISRRELVERKISEGATIEVSKGGERRLTNPDGSYLGQSQIGKIAIDYAEYLKTPVKLEDLKVTVTGIRAATGEKFQIPDQPAKEAIAEVTAKRDVFAKILECLSA